MTNNDVAATRRQDVAQDASRSAEAERERLVLQLAVDILEDARGITLYADQVPVHTGRPGRSGSRRAVQVTGNITKGGQR